MTHDPAMPGVRSRAALDREAASRDGCVELRRARETGLLVGLYRSREAGIEEDAELPYSVVCEAHGAIVSCVTLTQGRAAIACPTDWCDTCREHSETR